MGTLKTKKMTAAEFAVRYANRDERVELICGEVHEMSPALPSHGMQVVRITLPIAQFVQERGLGEVFGAETGFTIRHPDGTESVRAPDLAFISAERLPPDLPQSFWEIAPDLVVEVLSPSESQPYVQQKTAMWLAAGVRLVWNVDPYWKTVTVHRADGSTQILKPGDTLSGEDVLPGFELPVSQIFQPVRSRPR
jgi:Uma2 family endonuclease